MAVLAAKSILRWMVWAIPCVFRLSPGQVHDIKQAAELLRGFAFQRVIADRSYAAKDFVGSLLERGIEVVIPPHQRAKAQRDYDRWLYRERHLVECFHQQNQAFPPRLFPI